VENYSGGIDPDTGLSLRLLDFLNAFPPKFVIARKVVKDLAKYDSKTPSPVDNIRLGLTVFKPVWSSPPAAAPDRHELRPPPGLWGSPKRWIEFWARRAVVAVLVSPEISAHAWTLREFKKGENHSTACP
jgi:hypothetical protein